MDVSIIFPLLAGLAAGWLINYLADVLPHTRRFSQPVCQHCNEKMSWSAYVLLHPCQACGKPRTIRTWVVYLISVVVSYMLWANPHPKLGFALGLVLLIYLSVVFAIDLEHRLILHPVSIFGAFLGLWVGWLLHGLGPTLWGGLGGLLIMLVFYLFGTVFARVRARRMQAAGQETDDEEALGFGDVILAGVLGLMLGWPLIWFCLLIGALFGGVVSLFLLIGMLIVRRYKQDAWMVFIPYGPFLLISAIAILYLPNLISHLVPR